MDKRVRSPNYPALSLPDAVQRVALVYKNQHTHGAPREVVVKSMGYNSLNGASATAVSALIKYGLLEGRADEIRVSERAMRILHPEAPEERAQAIQAAGAEPALFQELDQRFPGRVPSEEVLRNHLVRTGFSPNAVSSVILAYRDTKDFVEREAGPYVRTVEPSPEATPMQPAQVATPAKAPTTVVGQRFVQTGDFVEIAGYRFEGGGSVRIIVEGDVDTETALDTIDTIIPIKRKELERRKQEVAKADARPKNEDIRGEDNA